MPTYNTTTRLSIRKPQTNQNINDLSWTRWATPTPRSRFASTGRRCAAMRARKSAYALWWTGR